MITGVGEAQDLIREALHFSRDRLAIAIVERAVRAFCPYAESASQRLHHAAQGRVCHLKLRLQGRLVPQELIILPRLIMIANELGHGGGIVAEGVNLFPGRELLSRRIEVLAAGLNGKQKVGQKVGIESNGHDYRTMSIVVVSNESMTETTRAEA